ncbi:MAG: response regulator [Sphingomonas sp.]|nr:response regulator [Sphingomonas sp.]
MIFGRKKRQLERLLIAEDEPLIAFENERFLTDAGFTVVATVDRVADALALIGDGQTIDLVLADISLADGSGLDIAKAAFECGIKVLFVTGEFPETARAIAAGCLTKPYQQRDLLLAIDAIEAVIGGEEPRRLPPGFNLFATAA